MSILPYLLFLLGFPLLIKGADFLVTGASSIAKKYKIPNIVIGLTIVSIGTSTPEMFVNLFASFTGNTDLAIGNILGSNIANILLILGVSALIFPITAKRNTVLKEIPFSLLAAVLVGILVNDQIIDGRFGSGLSRIDGLVLLSFLIIFMYYVFGISKSTSDIQPEPEIKKYSLRFAVLLVILGLTGLSLGGNWIVDGAVTIAQNFGISQTVIGLTIVAVGTSLPELATSAVAAYKKESDIAIGNIVGSNIINTFLILGVTATIAPVPLIPGLEIDLIINIFASLLLLFAMFTHHKLVLERWQGAILLLTYLAYLSFRIMA